MSARGEDPVFATPAERAEFEAMTAACRAVLQWIDADPSRDLVGCTPAMVAHVAVLAYKRAITGAAEPVANNPEIVTHFQPFDKSVLIAIYLDGFGTGVGSAALSLGRMSEQDADKASDKMVAAVQNDPAVMETIRREVFERITGVESGPYTLTVHGSDS